MAWFLIKIAALLCNNFVPLFYNNNSVYMSMVIHSCPRFLMCPYDFYVLFLFMCYHVLCVFLPHMSDMFTWPICSFWATHQDVQYFKVETLTCQTIREIFDKNFRFCRFLELISRKNLLQTAKIQEKNFSTFEIFTVKATSVSIIVSRIRDIYNNKYIKVSYFDLRV